MIMQRSFPRKRFISNGRSFANVKLQVASLWLVAAIIACVFTACNKKSQAFEESTSEGVTQQQNAVTQTTESYAKILNGDLSDFAGIYVNNRGQRMQLKADGVFGEYGKAYNFNMPDNNIYEWIVNLGGEAGGFDVWLYPVGVEVRYKGGEVNGKIIKTDTTKVRIVTEIRTSDDVYYFEGEASVTVAETATEEKSFDYSKILNGDLSEFAGIWWINNAGESMQLSTEYGPLTDAGGRFIDNFMLHEDGYYYWNVGYYDAATKDGYSQGIYLYPPGVEIRIYSYDSDTGTMIPTDTVPSDTTKARMGLGMETPNNENYIYYITDNEPYMG